MNFILALALLVSGDPFGKKVPVHLPQLAGTYECKHNHWEGKLTLKGDGKCARETGETCSWTFDGKRLVLTWMDSPIETLDYKAPGRFEIGYMKMQLVDPPKYEAVVGLYDGNHPHWKDIIELRADGRVVGKAGKTSPSGVWILNGKELVLYWMVYGPETVTQVSDGIYAHAGGFKLTKLQPVAPPVAPAAPVAKNIFTDKKKYKVGESITVTYQNMKGDATDWTNVILASGATDDWGNWEYTNGTATGKRTIKLVIPGEYEARAYYSGGTELVDRWSFTVEK